MRKRVLLIVICVTGMCCNYIFGADVLKTVSAPKAASSAPAAPMPLVPVQASTVKAPLKTLNIREIGLGDDASVKAFLVAYGNAVWAESILIRYRDPCSVLSAAKCEINQARWDEISKRASTVASKYELFKQARFVYEVLEYKGGLQSFGKSLIEKRHEGNDKAIEDFTRNVLNGNFTNINEDIVKAGKDLEDFTTKYNSFVDKFFELFEKESGKKIEF